MLTLSPASLLALISFLIPLSVQQSTCNGSPALCSRIYSNVTFIGTHDSAFVGDLPSDNQNVDVTAQLNAGIRFLQAQVHDFLGQLTLCHTSCILLDAGSLTSYLSKVKTWMDANPQEVVSLLLTNGDSADVSRFSDAFESTGLQQYAFIPAANPLPINQWPTLGSLITSGSRLIAMLDYGADASVAPFILDEFSYYFETPYDVTSTSAFASCNIDRPAGASAAGRMSIINHFLDVDILGIDIPDEADAATTNAAQGPGSIGQQAAVCAANYGKWPNVVLVDWFDEGNVFAAQNTFNGI